MKSAEDRIFDIVAWQLGAKLGVKKDKLDRGKSLIGDLGADSLDQTELVMAIEEEFEICILEEDAERINTVGDLIDCVKAKLGQK